MMKPRQSLKSISLLLIVAGMFGMLLMPGCGGGSGKGNPQVDSGITNPASSEEDPGYDTSMEMSFSASWLPAGMQRLLDDYELATQVVSTEENSMPAEVEAATPNNPGDITMVLAGDVMLARGVDKVINKAGKGDYTFPWKNAAAYFSKADISFVNLESIITNKGTYDWTKITGPWFRANPLAVKGLQAAGIDVVSVANNHCFDYGQTGLNDSLTTLENAGIQYTGVGTYEKAYTPVYIEANGNKVAFLSYTNQVLRSSYAAISQAASQAYTDAWGFTWPDSWGAAWLNDNMLEKGIYKAKADGANLIVVSMHYGVEYSTTPSTFEFEAAEHAIDAGANIVIGHGPHVIQMKPVSYNNGVIAYSLGNFIFDQYESWHPGVSRGMVLEVTARAGKIDKVTPRYVKINQTTWQPDFEAASKP
jgi:poly-gamma-glutamate capsule biosynthesis protein CapA/YwtB (metallophosphatase superfamily)